MVFYDTVWELGRKEEQLKCFQRLRSWNPISQLTGTFWLNSRREGLSKIRIASLY